MTGTRVSAVTAYTAHRECAAGAKPRGHRVRELVCSYRPVRDHEGRIISVSSLALSTPHVAAQIIAPLMADHPVEMFAVACLSAKNRLLAWHVVSRGTRSSTPVSIPDVFVPACVTPVALRARAPVVVVAIAVRSRLAHAAAFLGVWAVGSKRPSAGSCQEDSLTPRRTSRSYTDLRLTARGLSS